MIASKFEIDSTQISKDNHFDIVFFRSTASN